MLQGTGLTSKHKTGLERLAGDKYSSLLRKFVNYVCKKFYNFVTRSDPLSDKAPLPRIDDEKFRQNKICEYPPPWACIIKLVIVVV